MSATAGKMRKRYQHHFDRTGKRFEVEEADKKAAEGAAEKARSDALKLIRIAAPDMLAALKRLVPDDFHEHPGDFADDWHQAVAAIAKAEGRA